MTRILIADDLEENRYMLTSLCKGSGWETEAAGNGAEALERALRSPPDLIITDILMPVMDGFELCRRWKAHQDLCAVPFVFYTATYTDLKDEQFALSLGAERFVVKPQQPELLLALLREVLEEAGQRRPGEGARPAGDEAGSLRLHNEALLRKLEKKVAQLQAEAAERQRHEQELRESEGRYRTIYEGGTQGILVYDPERRHIIHANPLACRMFGWSLEELRARGLDALHPAEARDRVLAAFQAWGSESAAPAEPGVAGTVTAVPCLRQDGTVFYADLQTGPVVMQGRRCSVGFLVDATARTRGEEERQRLEDQLRTSQKMEAIGRLAGGIAHDFNNLLSVILAYTEFAQKRVLEGDPLRADLQEVRLAGERAAALTRQLLAFSRKQLLQPVPLDLNQVAAGVEQMLRRILGEDIDYLQILAPDLGMVHADPGQIEQVLMNLVVNARDAMPAGGKLTVETSNVEIDEEYAASHLAVKPGPYVLLAVSDTGCGMSEEVRSRLFEPFFTTKAEGKGTGLGLSTVYGIVSQSGGNVWVYSEPGRGSTFKIYLPRRPAVAGEAVRRPPAAAHATGTETILLVEDEEALCKVARRALEEAGYTVLVAADGEEALQTFRRYTGDIRLVVTDVVMPRMGGRLLADEMAKARPELPVLYMSGYTDDAIVHHGVLEEGTHFIGKPFTGADLTRRVREVLDGGR